MDIFGDESLPPLAVLVLIERCVLRFAQCPGDFRHHLRTEGRVGRGDNPHRREGGLSHRAAVGVAQHHAGDQPVAEVEIGVPEVPAPRLPLGRPVFIPLRVALFAAGLDIGKPLPHRAVVLFQHPPVPVGLVNRPGHRQHRVPPAAAGLAAERGGQELLIGDQVRHDVRHRAFLTSWSARRFRSQLVRKAPASRLKQRVGA